MDVCKPLPTGTPGSPGARGSGMVGTGGGGGGGGGGENNNPSYAQTGRVGGGGVGNSATSPRPTIGQRSTTILKARGVGSGEVGRCRLTLSNPR